MKADIAVVGSGLAALIATRTLQQAGRNAVLIWPGLSSLYFTYATVDVLGYSDLTTTQPVDQPEAGVARLIADHPEHPYALAGLDALRDGTALFIEWLREAGFTWQGSLARNLLLPTAIGTPKPSCLVPESMAAGDLRRDEPIVLCGFHGYEDFVPELAASNLSRSWGHGDQAVRAIRVSLPGFDARRLFTSIDLARSFEDEAFRREAAARIRREIAVDGVRIGVPAVLGLTHDTEVYSSFLAEIGHPVFEIPTLPPSVLGLRLFDRLRKHIQESGVEMIWAAPAHEAEVSDGQCRRIFLKSAGREQPIDARAYVLALEDTVDGALRAGVHTVVDPFFHHSLAYHAVPTERTDESLFKPQPFASIGYQVTDRLQPRGDDGRPLAGNVFVAGGAIAGYDPVGTKSRGGLAIATGYRAAKEAMAA
jgi:glycerol-3-phosphate dehydrogenase subunit B